MADKQITGLKHYNANLNKVICESLRQALILLTNQKDFSSITITELCKKAGVSRMAFYNNYKTKMQLLQNIVLEGTKELVVQIGSPFRDYTGVEWYKTMFKGVEKSAFYLKTIFAAGFKYEYLSIVNGVVLHDPDIPATDRYRRLMWAGAVVNTIIEWVESGMKEPVDDIAAFCFTTVMGKIKQSPEL